MERTIRVTGKGKISVVPDMICLLITQLSVEPTYEGAIRESADRKNELNAVLSRLDFNFGNSCRNHGSAGVFFAVYNFRSRSSRKWAAG